MQFASRKVHPAKKPPCFKCEERQTGCHVVCERYAEFQQQRRAELDAISAAYQKEHTVEDYVIAEKRKNMRKTGGKK